MLKVTKSKFFSDFFLLIHEPQNVYLVDTSQKKLS